MFAVEYPSKQTAEYLKLTGYTALALFTTPRGIPTLVMVTDDIASTRDMARRYWQETAELGCAYWIERLVDAHRLVEDVRFVYETRGDSFDTYTENVRDVVEKAARKRAITISNHQIVIQHIKDAMEILNRRIAGANTSGEMAIFNHRFKEYRKTGHGKPMVYNQALAKLRVVLLKRALRGNGPGIDSNLLDEVFLTDG